MEIGGAAPSGPSPAAAPHHRVAMLDGWRALSILLVLAAHLLPLGPARYELNAAAGAMGMALFFILSGFLITRVLDTAVALRVFLIRRLFRIVPLAWAASVIVLVANRADAGHVVAALLFYGNLPPFRLLPGTGHLWSLAVVMQFYLAVALMAALGGRRALLLLPLFALVVTAGRIATSTPVSIVTWLRVDEILAGGTLALAHAGRLGPRAMAWMGRLPIIPLLILLLLASHEAIPVLPYARPYLAAAVVGSSLARPPALLARLFESRAAAYVADISYALYIIHGVLAASWIGAAPYKYPKRPLLFALTFALAHLSTYRFERPCIAFAKRLTRHLARPAVRDTPHPISA